MAQLGMVGLGRMGANLVRRLMRDGHDCVVYDVNPDPIEQLAVIDLVVLALDAEIPRLARLGPRPDLEQLVPLDDLGADEAALQIGVDDAGCLRGARPGPERPGPAL